MWKVSACNCSICQIKVRGNIFLCIGAFSRQGAGYARANETASASPKSSMEKQLANRSGQKNVTGKRTRHTARKQDGAYCTRHDYKTPGGKQGTKRHYIVTMQSICGSIQRTIDTQVIFLCSYGWDFQSSMREAGQLVPCETKALFIFAGDSFASCWRRG